VYNTLEECDEQVNNFTSSYYKKFPTIEEANEEFERYQLRIKRKKEKLNCDDKIVIYTDGSHKNNQKGSYAGIGVYYEDGSKQITEPLPGDLQTNNRAELYAKTVKKCDVKNKDLFEKIDFLLSKRPGEVYFTHVFGHKGITGNELADKLARQGAAIKMNESKKLSPYNAFMKANLSVVKKNRPDLDIDTQDSINKDVVLSKKEQFWWFRENDNTNFRRPIMYPDNDGYITEYTQIKLNDKQNALLDRKHREFLKQHKFVLDKNNNIIEAITKEFLLELLYKVKLANIEFKNGYPFDLRE
ncbi:10927_t:CDS:2, partial [Racocetra persica]